jgi:hypothetical protein
VDSPSVEIIDFYPFGDFHPFGDCMDFGDWRFHRGEYYRAIVMVDIITIRHSNHHRRRSRRFPPSVTRFVEFPPSVTRFVEGNSIP